MADNKSAGDIAADTYEALTRAEQEHRYWQDAHTIHVWEGGCPDSQHACTARRVAAWQRVQAAQATWEARPSMGWTR